MSTMTKNFEANLNSDVNPPAYDSLNSANTLSETATTRPAEIVVIQPKPFCTKHLCPPSMCKYIINPVTGPMVSSYYRLRNDNPRRKCGALLCCPLNLLLTGLCCISGVFYVCLSLGVEQIDDECDFQVAKSFFTCTDNSHET